MLSAETPMLGERKAPVEFAGESAYFVPDKNGELKLIDSNQFSLLVENCTWRLKLDATPGDGRYSEVADDGTNQYVVAHGAGGTSGISSRQVSTRYVDSARIRNSGTEYPRFHGTGIWLLLASSCSLGDPEGRIGNVLGQPSLTESKPFFYQRINDANTNSFGPSSLSLYIGTSTNISKRWPIAKLDVIEIRRERGMTIPTRAELKMYDPGIRNDDGTPRFVSLYAITISTFKAIATVVHIRPQLENASSILDYRFTPHLEYISDSWKTVKEAEDLQHGDMVAIHPAPRRTSHTLVKRVFFCLVIISSLSLVALAIKHRLSRTSTQHKQQNQIIP